MADNGNTDAGGDRGRTADDKTARRQEAVALLLASGSSVRSAARRSRVGERTVHRWLDEDARFRGRVQELREQLFAQAVGVLTRLAGKAARRLNKLLDSPNEAIRLGACRTVLEAGPRLRELTDFEARLRALEEEFDGERQEGQPGEPAVETPPGDPDEGGTESA